jgi:hypothetical protein
VWYILNYLYLYLRNSQEINKDVHFVPATRCFKITYSIIIFCTVIVRNIKNRPARQAKWHRNVQLLVKIQTYPSLRTELRTPAKETGPQTILDLCALHLNQTTDKPAIWVNDCSSFTYCIIAEIKIAVAETASNKKTLFTSTLDFSVRKKLIKCYIWSIVLCGVEIWTLWKVDQKCLESLEM